MADEKQIKQMANTCEQYRSCACCPYNPEDNSKFGIAWKGGCPNYDRKLVYAMGKGYRNCKDKVVLTREEYSDYLILQRNHEFIREKAKQLQEDNERLYKNIGKFKDIVRKETAREIFDTIIKALEERKEKVKAFYGVPESVGADVAIRTVKELAKQLGVEVEE